MCWMSIRTGDDALGHAVREVQRVRHIHRHSWGVAWVEDGEIHIEKGVGTMPTDLDVPDVDVGMAHARLATRGLVCEENAHPFAIRKDGEVVAALAHNGTWLDAPDAGYLSDSYVMARYLEELLKHFSFETALEEMTDRVGETVIVLHRSGAAYAYSGRYDITCNEQAAQSDGLRTTIPTGELVELDDDDQSVLGRFTEVLG